ncbi:hypothetical protein AC1031_020078 [Aphanomyces cochlioides]|nr:hypothetical protein AC1031_020078 [Aphanomyces cochlioides]
MKWFLYAAAAAAASFSLTVTPTQAATTAQCATIEENTDYPGNDITSTQQSTAEGCCADCANTAGCKVYVWNSDTKTCFLKSQPVGKSYYPGARAAKLVLSPGTCSAIQKDTDLPGNDIGDALQVTSVDQCCTYCANTQGCVAYVLSPANADGTAACHLKNAKGTPSSYTGAQAAYLVSTTTSPTSAPTTAPVSVVPTVVPTVAPTTAAPTIAPTTAAPTTAAPTIAPTTAAPTVAPTTAAPTTAAVTAAPTLSPTSAPSSGQCAAVQNNTDYPGNDLAILQKDTVADCCAACSTTSDCKVFVWVMRDVGTCILKSAIGQASTFTGAVASYPIVPTPAPTPSLCSAVESDVDYAGNDIMSVDRANYQDCCSACRSISGCSLYVWSSGTCYLKSSKGEKSSAPGAKAAVLPVLVGTTPLSNVMSEVFGTFPLPSIAFNYIAGGQWINQATLSVVNQQVEAFIIKNKEANFSHDAAQTPMFTLEADLGLNAYINVTSRGECATLTAAFGSNFFTYLPNLLYCFVHLNSDDTSLQMLTATGQAIVFPQNLDDVYKSSTQSSVDTNAACVTACKTQGSCAGVVYSSSAKTCTFYQPKSATSADVVAGWVNQAVFYVDNGSIQYSKMPMMSLPKAYVTTTMPSITSVDACATYASSKKSTLFGYNKSSKSCVLYTPTTSTTKSLSMPNTPSVPVVLSGAFGSDVTSASQSASSSLDCYKLCLPSQNNCFASVFDSTAKTCATYQAISDVSTTLGWIIPKTLPTSMTTVKQVDFYVTAHQDDHELFMSVPVYNSLKNPTTKAVFVYTSGGDAGQTDGWWQAREFGTLAATKAWVNMFGAYSPVLKNETVLMNNHHIVKITIGNAIHYFLRMSEDSLTSVLLSNTKKAPMDQPKETYANAAAVKATIKAIILAEATKVAKVTASYSEYLTDPSNDHALHVATGQITAELLNSDARFKSCISQTPYFGYQHWLDDVTMKDPERTAQRNIWLNLGLGILTKYPRNIWTDHSMALGRSYTGTPLPKTSACNF